jgi:hypothetical protein
MTENTDARRDEFSDPEDWRRFALYLSEVNRFIFSDYWDGFMRHMVRTSHKSATGFGDASLLLTLRLNGMEEGRGGHRGRGVRGQGATFNIRLTDKGPVSDR